MRTPILLLATLALPPALGAQAASVTRDSQAVADVASRYLVATMLRDHARAAALADPAQVTPLRAHIVRELERQDESERAFRAMRDSMEAELKAARTRADSMRAMHKRSTSSGILTVDSTYRRARALGVDTALARRHGGRVLAALRGRPTLATLLALPDTAFLAIVLAGNEDYVFAEMARRDPRVAAADRSPPSADDLPTIRVVDVVIERDSVAHVLVRQVFPGGEERFDWDDEHPAIMTTQLLQLRRRPGGWRVRLGQEEWHDLESAVIMSRMPERRAPK